MNSKLSQLILNAEHLCQIKVYGEGEREKFTSITALVFFKCVVNYIYTFVMSFVDKEKDATRSSHNDICSFTYLLAMVTSN